MVADDLSVVEAWAKRNQESVNFNGGVVHGGKKGARCLQAKRKRGEYEVVDVSGEGLRDMLGWICRVAMNPRAPTRVLGGDQMSLDDGHWGQAIRAREVLTRGRPGYLTPNRSLLQKRVRAHPLMYVEFLGSGQVATRCSSRVSSQNKDSVLACCSDGSHSLENKSNPSIMAESALHFGKDRYKKRIRIGPKFQAEIPVWECQVPEPECEDSRWLGEEQWPLEFTHRDVDAEFIGKGRPNSCGCRLRGSVECVRFHVAEKRSLLKRELGHVFYTWKFDEMGEEISLTWTEEEEIKFKVLVCLNPPSQVSSFWVPIYRSFPFKSRQNLVSYYFNVFLQRRRSYQNRVTPKNIDSDDEESAFAVLGGRLSHEKLSECWFEPIYCFENRQCDPLAVID